MEIFTNPSSNIVTKIHPVQGRLLTVRRTNGLGARWTSDGIDL